MANVTEPTQQMQDEWSSWVEERPACVREVARRFAPWKLYRMKDTGHRVLVSAFDESKSSGIVSCRVIVSGQFNAVSFERQVFGIDPNNLEECDLPSPSEPVGALLSQDQVVENIDEIRLRVRPDLWERRADGVIVWKADGKPKPYPE
jgi:hypothetical protein